MTEQLCYSIAVHNVMALIVTFAHDDRMLRGAKHKNICLLGFKCILESPSCGKVVYVALVLELHQLILINIIHMSPYVKPCTLDC